MTTKLNNGFHRPDDARRAFEESLEKLGLDRVDLFLIHWPLPTQYDGDFVSTWKTLAELAQDGRATSIGVSNFEPAHLERIIDETGVLPAVNQIEVHPFFGNEAARAAGAEHRIVTEAWSPIAQGKVIGNEVLAKIGAEHGKSESQVALRWHIERGDVVFPKSMTRRADAGELRDLRLLPHARAGRADQRPRPGRVRPDGPEPERVRLHPRLIATRACCRICCGLVPNRNKSGASACSL